MDNWGIHVELGPVSVLELELQLGAATLWDQQEGRRGSTSAEATRTRIDRSCRVRGKHCRSWQKMLSGKYH